MLPEFICIGAQKAGTTWLYRNIKHHPDVWMPPVKEIHYFDDSSPQPMIMRIFNRQKKSAANRIRNILVNQLRHPMKPGKKQHIRWYLRFLLMPRNDKWYASLFSPASEQIAGDVTPAYAVLEKSMVRKIHALMPNAKIIYLLRNPIDLRWSQTGMYFSKFGHQGLHTISDTEIQALLAKEKRARHSEYLKNLRIWEHFYPKDQIFIGFFDRLTQDPGGLLTDIYHFLGLDCVDPFIPQRVSEKRNAGQYPAIPDHFAGHLTRRHYEQIKKLHQRFANNYTANWLELAEQRLKLE